MNTDTHLALLYRHITQTLKNGNIDTPDLDARRIIEERTSYTWSDIIAYPDSPVKPEQRALIMRDITDRLAGKPLSRIYKAREFWGLSLALSEDTLDPRPDTETLIDLALHRFPDKNAPIHILDLGTGSGCILIALLSEFPNATGYGIDISAGAVKYAQNNAQAHSVNTRAHFICGSWLDALCAQCDLIVSNPPYIARSMIPALPPEVGNHDPILALDGGADGLGAYRIIFPHIKFFFNTHGIALFEIGYDQEKYVMRLAEESGLSQPAIHHDLAGNPRVVEISCGDK